MLIFWRFQLFRLGELQSLCVSEENFFKGITIQFKEEEESSSFHGAFEQLKSDVTTQGSTLPNGTISSSKSKFDDKIESSSAKMYFHYYGQLLHQQNMLQDYVPTMLRLWRIMQILPGRVVFDVGAGSGILSLFAAQAGAKHVYAVKHLRWLTMHKSLLRGTLFWTKNYGYQGKSRRCKNCLRKLNINLRAYGECLSRMHCKRSVSRPYGKMFPTVGRIHMAPFSDEYLYVEVANKQQNYYGVDLTALHGTAFQGYFSQPVVDAFDPRLLVAPAVSHVINFTTIKEEDLYEIDVPLKFSASVGTRVHGLACCTVQRWLTTAPWAPTTHWYQLRCVLSQPIYVMPGQEITGRLHMIAHSAQSYTINLTMSAKMWGPGAEQGGILQTSSCRLDLKEPYYRMSQPQAYSVAQDQQPNQLLQSQDLQLRLWMMTGRIYPTTVK
ncbi:putative methyltransferase [Helianthus annuus]|nr:putative methyltransferase [Helianthus annuus]